MPVLTIDAKDFFRGMSTSDELADGGFSPLSKGINLFASPGLVLPGALPVDQSSGVTTGGIFAWSSWHTNVSPGIGRGLGSLLSNQDGKFFTLSDAGAATLADSDTGRNYVANESDMIRYASAATPNLFSSSQTDICLSNFDFSVQDYTWWTGTKGKAALTAGVPHHFTQYGAILYWTNGRVIQSWDGSTANDAALNLPFGYIATDIEVHQNLIFIAASKFDPIGGGECIDNRIFTWDGFSPTFIDEYVVQQRIDSLIVFGGVLYVTTQKFMGYFTGATISPLYPLTSPVYHYQYAITNDRLYLLQGSDLLCYGNPIVSKPKFFSFPLKHSASLIGINSYRVGKIAYAYASASGAWSDVNGSDSTGVAFYSNKMNFGRQVKIRKIILETELLASGAVQTTQYIDDEAATQTPSSSSGVFSYALHGAVGKHKHNVFNTPATHTAQFKHTFTTGPNKGLRRATVWYEASELTENA